MEHDEFEGQAESEGSAEQTVEPEEAAEAASTDEGCGYGGADDEVGARLHCLESMLRRTRSSRRAVLFAEGFLWYVAGLAAVVVSALTIAAIVPAAVPAVTGWMLMVGGGAATVLGALLSIGFWQGGQGLDRIARRLQQADASFRNDIVGALEFGRAMQQAPEADDRELGFSRAMGREHVRRTTENVKARAKDGHLAHLLEDRALEPPLLASVGAMGLVTAAVLAAPGLTLDVLKSPLAQPGKTPQSQQVVRPIIGNLRLHYSAPRYTGRGEHSEPFSSGHIKAIVGSEVTLTGQPLLEDWKSLEMVVETGGGDRTLNLERRAGGRVVADMVITEPGSYRFRAVREDGTTVTDGMHREIDVIPDEKPNVTVTSHSGEIEVSPEDILEVEFSVNDDFGVESVARLHYFHGDRSSKEKKPLNLAQLKNGTPQSVDGTVQVDLRPLALRPKDRVIFYLQATDNNSQTGPGVGRSNKLVLHVSSPEDKHLQLIQEQRQLSEKLLSLLADYLEHPMGRREPQGDGGYEQVVPEEVDGRTLADRYHRLQKIHRREAGILESMKKLVGKMKQDPLMVERDLSLFEGLHGHFRELHEEGGRLYERVSAGDGRVERLGRGSARRIADHAARMEENLEKGILRLMELIASQKMGAVKATREDIKKLKGRLKQLLKKYKKSKDPELKEAIKREIQRLRQRMAELVRRMQMQIRKLPEEHLNKKALKQAQMESEGRKISDSLKSMEEMLAKGDIDGALKALERMDQTLKSLGSQMDQQFSAAQPKGLSKLDKKMSELMNKVNDLRAAEKELEEKTRELQRQQVERRQKQVEQMLEEFTRKLRRKVDRQTRQMEGLGARDLPRHVQSGLEENRKKLGQLEEALEQKDIKGALEAARESVENLQTMRFNLGLAQRQARQGSGRAQVMDRSLEDIKQMVPRGQEIERELEDMMEKARRKMQQGNSQELKELAEKQRKVGEQADKLKEQIGEASKEFPMLKQQLQPSLKKARGEMKKAEERLGKGQPQGALDSERSALQRLGELKKQMKRTLQKKRQQQQKGRGAGHRKDDVEIPGDDDKASRQKLRREMMEAMKEGKIEDYEKEIENYYKSLVK